MLRLLYFLVMMQFLVLVCGNNAILGLVRGHTSLP